MLLALGQFVAGVALLLVGGDAVVRGASRLAALARLSPLFIGLTVVSLGTSAPEMAVSVSTAMKGQADITIGNVVGSNLFNMLMIVGVSASWVALPVLRQITSFDVPVMVLATILMWLMGLDGALSRMDGVILLICLIAYFAISYRLGKERKSAVIDSSVSEAVNETSSSDSLRGILGGLLWNLVILAFGVAALVWGCDWFIAACVYIARTFGLSEIVIGLTIVSAGTSLPELVTSVAATIKGERGIAIGNAVGSTILNVFAVLGVTAFVAPDGVSVDATILRWDAPIMILVAAISWVVFRTGRTIQRREGFLLIGIYLVYVGYLLYRNGALG
ncbi:MAG: calcium/sodium antiporter [Planctomycetota bacterium]